MKSTQKVGVVVIIFNVPSFSMKCLIHSLVRALREELHQLQEPGSYVGEVVKPMGKTKILVKVCILY